METDLIVLLLSSPRLPKRLGLFSQVQIQLIEIGGGITLQIPLIMWGSRNDYTLKYRLSW